RRLTGISPPERSKAIVEAIAARFAFRANILHMPSVKAARQFDDESLDFVFIDAKHDYDSVKADIAAWRPKVKIGGWVCGHDYAPKQFPGCVKAVDEAFDTVVLRSDYTWF